MFKKIVFIGIGLITLVIIALVVFVKVYVKPENIRAFLIPQAEKALNRKVNLGEVNISLFKGIQVNNFAIKEQDGKTDFLTCKDFVLKYKLLPLLSKKLIIEELRLVSPQVRIERDTQGKYNFEGIGKKKKVTETKKPKDAGEPGGLPVSLLVDSIHIENATFSFLDQKKKLPDMKGALDVALGIKSVSESEVSSEGSIELKLDDIKIKKPTPKHIKDLNSALKYSAAVDIKSKDIRIDSANLKLQGISAALSGKLTNPTVSPEINLSVSIPSTKFSDIMDALSAFADLKGLELSGAVSADLNLAGMLKKLETMQTNGTVALKNAGITYNNVNTTIDGDLKFKGQTMNFDLKSKVGNNSANLKGTVVSYLKNQKITFNVSSDQLFLDELIPAGKAEKGEAAAQKKEPAQSRASSEAKPLDLKLTADGEIKIQSARYKGMTMSNFQTNYQFKNNRLDIKKMNASVGKGTIDLKSTVDLSRPGYQYNLTGTLDSIHADEFVNSFFPKAKDTIFGTLSAQLQANGTGTQPKSIKKNLVANGTFSVKDGKFTGNKLTENLALFLGINELKTILLNKAEGTVSINNGTAVLNSMFSSDDIAMDPAGNIGLLDETLNIAFDLRLSPRLSDKAMRNTSIATYIKDEEGWGRIPLKISRTISNPSYSIDVEKAGKRVIKKKAQELIDDLFNKGEDKQPVEGEQPKEEMPVKDLLKGLFK